MLGPHLCQGLGLRSFFSVSKHAFWPALSSIPSRTHFVSSAVVSNRLPCGRLLQGRGVRLQPSNLVSYCDVSGTGEPMSKETLDQGRAKRAIPFAIATLHFFRHALPRERNCGCIHVFFRFQSTVPMQYPAGSPRMHSISGPHGFAPVRMRVTSSNRAGGYECCTSPKGKLPSLGRSGCNSQYVEHSVVSDPVHTMEIRAPYVRYCIQACICRCSNSI